MGTDYKVSIFKTEREVEIRVARTEEAGDGDDAEEDGDERFGFDDAQGGGDVESAEQEHGAGGSVEENGNGEPDVAEDGSRERSDGRYA